jgi:deoxyribodipyrimidine photo-lyase
MKIVWFKRDLRLHDHEAMHEALSASGKTLLLYIFEPSVLNDYHYSQRHFAFIKQSLEALQKELLQYHTQILIVRGEAVPVFEKLSELISIKAVYSHQETGIQLTYERDLAVTQLLKEKGIIWNEYLTNGVIRGIKNRKKWKEDWYDYMDKDCLPFHPTPRSFVKYIEIEELENHFEIPSIKTIPDPNFQKGGVPTALRYMKSFFEERVYNYSNHISKPELGRKGCSRLSPYIAWGNLSIREVYTKAWEVHQQGKFKRQISNFA